MIWFFRPSVLARRPIRTKSGTAIAATLLLLQTEPILAQTLGQGVDDDISLWRIVAALLLCIALAVAGAFALRFRMGRGKLFSFLAARNRRLQLVETLRLSHQVDLCIVICDGRELLLATSAQGTDLIERLPPGERNIARHPEGTP